ncbi:MAG: acyltransferase [Deinococcota bacterium]|jgi:galactoside O-acetyltransferase|nr:acyltransferase [Deinococcota bacterium]
MPWLLPRPIPAAAETTLDLFVSDLAERLDDPGLDRSETVREVLAQVMHGASYEALEQRSPIAALALDPRNITFEAEHYVATDQDKFARVKPLLWLWKSLDLTPLGQSVHSGLKIRRMLAERVFARAGKNLKIFQNVEVSVGYNITAGDEVVIHRNVLIDDIGGVELHDGASLSDYVNVYSHSHDLLESDDVTLKRTVIGKGVRVAYHATVLSGTVLSDDAMLGALALATRDLEPHAVGLGIPAKARVWKSRGGDPRFSEVEVDAHRHPKAEGVRANPDYREAFGKATKREEPA